MKKQFDNPRGQRAGHGIALGKVALSVALAGALLSEAPDAKADERTGPPRLTLKSGAAYDHVGHDLRALAIMGSKLSLPADMSLDSSVGFGGSLTYPGSSNVEEAGLDLSVPFIGPLFMDLYGHNSRHLAVQQFSVGADAGISFSSGAAIIGFEHILDGGQRPLYGALVLDAVKDRLTLDVSGGYVTNREAGTAGAGFTFAPGASFPKIRLHTMTIYDSEAFLFADTRAMLVHDL